MIISSIKKIILALSLSGFLVSCDIEVQKLNLNSESAKQIWTKQSDLDLGYRIEMLSDNFGIAISRGKGTDVPGKLYFYENRKWIPVFSFPYSDYPFVKSIDQNNFLFVIHGTHSGNYKPRMFIINRKTKKKKEIILPKIMWDQKDYSMWKSISFYNHNKAWMVGQLGNLLFFDGRKWKSIKSPLADIESTNIMRYDLNDVSINTNGNGWAVGRSGLILRLKNGVWQNFLSPTQKELNKVISVNESIAWVVGEKGTVLKFDGEKWVKVNTETSENLLSIKYFDKKNIWISGSSSTLLHFDGIAWNQINDVKLFPDTFTDIDIVRKENDSFSIFLIGNDGIYSNSQNLEYSFSNITSESALQRNGISAIFFDANNDSYSDLLVKSENGPNLFYKNEFGTRFSEVPFSLNKPLELSRSFHSSDLNNDGNQDIVSIENEKSFAVLFGKGNFDFIDKTEVCGIAPGLFESTPLPNSIQTADFNNDGNLDLYISNYNQNDLLFKGDGAGHFILQRKNTGITKYLNHESHGFVFSDFNNDNLIDIFIFYRVPADNQFGELYLNKDNFVFEKKLNDGFLTTENPIVYSALANDFNNDGNTDLLIYVNEKNIHLLLNNGKADFIDYSHEAGFTQEVFHPEPSNGIIAAEDINNDGCVDLFAGSDIYINNGNAQFIKSESNGLSFTGNPVFSDIDNDGDMDIFIGSSRYALGSGDRSALFRNNLNKNNFVKIKLAGSKSTKDAVGAKIFLYGYDKKNRLVYKTIRQNLLGGNPLSQIDPTTMHFGLQNKLKYKAAIIFPSGIKKEILEISAGNILTVYEENLLERLLTNISKSFSRTLKIINPLLELIEFVVFIIMILLGAVFIPQKKYRKNTIKFRFVLPFVLIYFLTVHITIFYGELNSVLYSFGFAVPLFWIYAYFHSRYLEKADSKYISHYKLIDVIGVGGMGKVFRVVDTNNKKIVALKVINPTLLKEEENQKRLSAEGEIMSSFDHPNIIKVFEVAKTAEHTFIAMEFLNGGNLEEFIMNNYPVKFSEAKKILLQICEGLIAIHSKNVIHRDLKSANIMFDDNRNLRIMDFGLSKSPLVTTMTSLGTVLGTLGFVAPEQVTNINVDHRTDIFSFGVIMYQLFTNQLPFKGENEIALIHSIFNSKPIAPEKINPDFPVGMEKIICRCLEKNPENRYYSVVEIKEELRRL